MYANFDGGTLTSDGGVVDLRAVDKSIGLIERLCDCISDDRHQSYKAPLSRTEWSI